MKKNTIFFLLLVLFFCFGIGKSYSGEDSMDQMQGMMTVGFDALKSAKENNRKEFTKCVDEEFFKSKINKTNEIGFQEFKKLISRLRVMDDFTKQSLTIDGEKGELGFNLETGFLKMQMNEVGNNWKIIKILFTPKSVPVTP